MNKEKKVFLITSCDSSYQKLNYLVSVIVQKILKYKLIISERDTEKDGQILLNTIYNSIKESEYILIDVIPDNFNIAFESGIAYVLREEKISSKKILFLAPQYLFDENIVPVDITGIKLTPFTNIDEYKNKILDFFKIKGVDKNIEDELNSIIKQIPREIRVSKIIRNEELFINTKGLVKIPEYNINTNKSIYNNLNIFVKNNFNSKVELTKIVISSNFPFFRENKISLFSRTYTLTSNMFKIQLENPIIISNDQELEMIMTLTTNSKIQYKDKYEFDYILNAIQSNTKIEGSFTVYTKIKID
ncbi:MAG: hypothetical protein E3J83_01770 [Candidatus Atribacteria bacterium]|nr:MAG: hypothetical protein E3J83_01770 [Candidatus Atribacteria bacterium]